MNERTKSEHERIQSLEENLLFTKFDIDSIIPKLDFIENELEQINSGRTTPTDSNEFKKNSKGLLMIRMYSV